MYKRQAYGDERNPLIEKSEFILSLFEQLVGAGGVSAKEKSILDRCTYDVYREYMANNYQGEVPTLKDLYHSLLKQPEPEAKMCIRDRLTPDEVRMLDNRKAILFVRGERPMLDDKYDLMRHPNIRLLSLIHIW